MLKKKSLTELYSEWYGEKVIKKIVIVAESDRFLDEFKDPTNFFVIDSMGNGVYFKTRNRETAQKISDDMYGKGKYLVRKAMKAAIR